MFEMYEYNGVKLPKIPETMDTAKYPYLLLHNSGPREVSLIGFTEKIYFNKDQMLVAGIAGEWHRFTLVNGEFVDTGSLTYPLGELIFQNKVNVFWTNWALQGIEGENGGVRFYPSSPVPVGKWITQRFTFELASRQNPVVIDAVQFEEGTRTWVISLTENGNEWYPPSGCDLEMNYMRADGVGGKSLHMFGLDDWAITGNIVSIIPPSDFFKSEGEVLVNMKFKLDGEKLSTFNFKIHVEKEPFYVEVVDE